MDKIDEVVADMVDAVAGKDPQVEKCAISLYSKRNFLGIHAFAGSIRPWHGYTVLNSFPAVNANPNAGPRLG